MYIYKQENSTFHIFKIFFINYNLSLFFNVKINFDIYWLHIDIFGR